MKDGGAASEGVALMSSRWKSLLARPRLAAAALAAGLVGAGVTSAQAQLFNWDSTLPPDRIERMVQASGYRLTGPVVRRGAVYLANVLGRENDPERLIIDAREGRLLQRFPAGRRRVAAVDAWGYAPRGAVVDDWAPRPQGLIGGWFGRDEEEYAPPRPPANIYGDAPAMRQQIPTPPNEAYGEAPANPRYLQAAPSDAPAGQRYMQAAPSAQPPAATAPQFQPQPVRKTARVEEGPAPSVIMAPPEVRAKTAPGPATGESAADRAGGRADAAAEQAQGDAAAEASQDHPAGVAAGAVLADDGAAGRRRGVAHSGPRGRARRAVPSGLGGGPRADARAADRRHQARDCAGAERKTRAGPEAGQRRAGRAARIIKKGARGRPSHRSSVEAITRPAWLRAPPSLPRAWRPC